jgi:hypothetical protein
MGANAPANEKNILKRQKIEQKISRLLMDILRAHIIFCEKPNFFVTCVKMTNKTSPMKPFCTVKFVFFTDDTQNVSFLWNHFVNV